MGKGILLVCHPAQILPTLTCTISQPFSHSVNNKRCAGTQGGAGRVATPVGCPSSPWHWTRPDEYKEDADPFILVSAHWCFFCQESLASFLPNLIHLSRRKTLNHLSNLFIPHEFLFFRNSECPNIYTFLLYVILYLLFQICSFNSNLTCKQFEGFF